MSAGRIYAAERRGDLVGIRIDNRVWYSRDRLVELFGSPSASGRQLSFGELDDDRMLA